MKKRIFAALVGLAGFGCIASGQSTDACSAANTVGEGTFPWSMIGATSDGSTPCAPAAIYDVWYRYVPSITGTATVSVCFSQYLNGTIVSVMDQCPSGSAFNTCVYNDGVLIPFPYCIGYKTVRFAATAGQSYYIRMAENSPDFSPPPFPRTVNISLVPGNDECSNAFPIGPGGTYFDTTNATNSTSAGPSCNGPGRDVWFSYTPPCTGNVDIYTCGEVFFRTNLGAYTACGATNIVCAQNNCGNMLGSHINFNVTGGTNYLIRVDGDDVGEYGPGNFILTYTPTAPPPNDECTGALPVGPGITTFNTGCATSSAGTTPLTSAPGRDLWFAYTATVNGVAEVKTCGVAFDTILSEYPTCGGTPISNDNWASCGFFQSRIAFFITTGTTYLIKVDGAGSGDYGFGAFTITQIPVTAPRPVNDNFADAIDLRAGAYAFSTRGATTDGTSSCADAADSPDVFFRYTPAATGTAAVDTCDPGRDFDTVLSALTTLGGMELACNNDACGLGSRVSFPVTAGVPVLIRAAGFNGQTGSATLTVTDPVQCNTGHCVADVDDGSGTGNPDGGVTIDDLLHYLSIFDAGTLCSDVDDGSGTGTRDGGVTIDDLLYYLARFDAGC